MKNKDTWSMVIATRAMTFSAPAVNNVPSAICPVLEAIPQSKGISFPFSGKDMGNECTAFLLFQIFSRVFLFSTLSCPISEMSLDDFRAVAFIRTSFQSLCG